MRKVKYGITGSTGRMGREITSVIKEQSFEIVFQLNSKEKIQTGVPDVLIDFSSPSALKETIQTAIEFNSPLVTGTTGLSENDKEELVNASRFIPIIQEYNFSVGIQILLKCTELLKTFLPEWDFEISEIHHRFKKDKPSGTALLIKDILDNNTQISSHRIGGVPGSHSILAASSGECLMLNHSALTRRTFAEGAVKCALWLKDKKPGIYSIKDVIFNSKSEEEEKWIHNHL